MKKYSFLFVFLLVSGSSFSQQPENATGLLLKKVFSKIPPAKLADLVPYCKNEKWGFIDRSTRKIIVKPLLYGPEFFTPDMRFYFNGEMINISRTGLVQVENNDIAEMNAHTIAAVHGDRDSKVKSSKNGFKGFIASGSGELIAYSDLYQYNTQGIPGWNIQLVKYKGKYFGVVKNLKGQAGVIDSEGIPLKGFDFNYHDIIPNRNTKDTSNAWFFVKQSASENYSLINTSGDLRFQNEIFNYPLLSSEVFGYTIYQKGDTSAIFDRYALSWLIKPQKKIRIAELFFSSREELDPEIPANRNHATIYYLVTDNKNKYFMDLKGNKYLPKE